MLFPLSSSNLAELPQADDDVPLELVIEDFEGKVIELNLEEYIVFWKSVSCQIFTSSQTLSLGSHRQKLK